MKRELARIEPVSVLRIGFFLGLFVGFIIGLLEGLLFKTLTAAGGSLLPPEAAQFARLTGGAVFLLAVVTGLACSLIFSLVGALIAVFYNRVARLFGGLEVFLSGDAPAPASGQRPPSPENESDV